MTKESKTSPSLPLPGIRWRGFTLQLFLITILPLAALLVTIVLVSQSLHHREMTVLVGDRNLRAVRATAVSLEEQLSHVGYSLQVASRLAGDPPDLNRLLENYDLLENEFSGGMAIYSREGGLVANSNQAEYWQGIPQDLPEFWDALLRLQDGQVEISRDLYMSDGGERFGLTGLTNRDGSLLVGAFSPERLIQNVLIGSLSSSGSALVVTDGQQRVIFQSGLLPEDGEQGQQVGVVSALNLESGVNYYSSRYGDLVVAFTPIQPAGWTLVISEAWEDIASPFLSTTQSAPLLLIPLLVLAIIALWFGARQIVQPIQQLVQRASRLARGEFDAIREPVGGIEEIRRLQNGLERMADDLQSAQSALRSYIGAITASAENERRNLARELHDDTLQALIALNQRVQLAKLNAASSEELSALQQVQEMIQQAMNNLRRMVRGMRPIYLEELGLTSAMEMLASTTATETGIKVEFSMQGEPRRLDDDIELALYRMAQEALNNAVRHAQASQIELKLAFSKVSLKLIIRDDGNGFNLPDTLDGFAREGHFGLLGLHERAELIGADLMIESKIGNGTLVEVNLEDELNKGD